MSRCLGCGATRGVRPQQVVAGGWQTPTKPSCPAASPAVPVGSNRVDARCPASLAGTGEPHLRTSHVVASSRGDEPFANSSQRRGHAPGDGDRRSDRRGGRGDGGRGGGRGGYSRGDGGARGGWDQWEGRRERRTDGDGGRGGRGGSYGREAEPRRPRDSDPTQFNRVSPRATLNRHLKEVQSCQELAQLLQNQPAQALTAHNIASAWVRLGNLQSKGSQARAAAAEAAAAAASAAADGGRSAAGEAEGATVSPCTTVVRQLLDPTTEAAAEMDLRQIANTLWGMAKVGDRALGSSGGGDHDGGSPDLVIQALQRRAVGQLLLLAPSGQDQDQHRPSGGGGGGAAPQLLDVRDATQMWYGMASLRFPWNEDMKDALEEATLRAMEAALAEAAGADGSARRDAGASGSGHSSGWSESPSAVAQLVFRMATVCKGMSAGHRARLAAIVVALSYDGEDPYDDDDGDNAPSPSYRFSAPLDNPDCLLVGAQLLRLDLPSGAVQRLHSMALALPAAAAARTGRTAMARALKSATSMGLQPSASEARRWQQRLLGELGGERWTCEELSWTMLALSYVKSYLPDAEARDEMLGALRRLVRQLRANDATRVQAALGAWGLRLPEREAALLRQKAGGEAWDELRPRGDGGRRDREPAMRSWGFGR